MSDAMRVSAAKGVELAVDIRGAGPPLMLIHGITDDRTLWKPVADLLSMVSRHLLPPVRWLKWPAISSPS